MFCAIAQGRFVGFDFLIFLFLVMYVYTCEYVDVLCQPLVR